MKMNDLNLKTYPISIHFMAFKVDFLSKIFGRKQEKCVDVAGGRERLSIVGCFFFAFTAATPSVSSVVFSLRSIQIEETTSPRAPVFFLLLHAYPNQGVQCANKFFPFAQFANPLHSTPHTHTTSIQCSFHLRKMERMR